MNLEQFRKNLNQFGKKNIPFFFIIDFELQKPLCFPLKNIPSEFSVSFQNIKINPLYIENQYVSWKVFPLEYKEYLQAFEKVQKAIHNGETYLLNLTFPSRLETKLSLEDIFAIAQAPYKVLRKKHWVFFSPEPFVKIENNSISTHPMKGTLDAKIKDAPTKLLENSKELYEHFTVTDLLRNDLAQVARKVKVKKFRYLEKIRTFSGEIWQTSSEITGELPSCWNEHIGDILLKLLPAGSVSGAPKERTLQIIREAEKIPRGYYSGISGIYQNKSLISAVNIRFIEEKNNRKFYRSGGGITAMSKPEEEYRELLKKIYVPLNGNN